MMYRYVTHSINVLCTWYVHYIDSHLIEVQFLYADKPTSQMSKFQIIFLHVQYEEFWQNPERRSLTTTVLHTDDNAKLIVHGLGL